MELKKALIFPGQLTRAWRPSSVACRTGCPIQSRWSALQLRHSDRLRDHGPDSTFSKGCVKEKKNGPDLRGDSRPRLSNVCGGGCPTLPRSLGRVGIPTSCPSEKKSHTAFATWPRVPTL